MRMMTSLILALGAVFAFAVPGHAQSDKTSFEKQELMDKASGFPVGQNAPLATPAGITFKFVRVGSSVGLGGNSNVNEARMRKIFADADNRTLYTYDKDKPGKSTCTGECEAMWPPAIAPADAKPVGDWSLVKRPDGRKQWAFRGQPFYTYSKEVPVKSTSIVPLMGMMSGAANGHDVDGVWHVFEVRPEWWLKLPFGVSVADVPNALGMTLSDLGGKPLYMFNGKARAAAAISSDWAPFRAPEVAIARGDFTVIMRDDGINQWAWHGKPLYTYSGDVELGDTNGKAVDPRFELTLVMKYYIPKEVGVLPNQARGGVLVTTDTGHVLYARDRPFGVMEGDHAGRGGNKGNSLLGRAIGLSGCDTDCEKTWRPLMAPAGAQPQGDWSVIARPDGAKQWVFQGYPLYAYSKEKPGEITGNDIFNVGFNSGTHGPLATNPSLYWRVTSP